MNTITVTEYADAVKILGEKAMKNVRDSKALTCAAVLLSIFNPYEYPLNIGLLWKELVGMPLYDAAIVAIRGRCELCREPQDLHKNGQEIMDEIIKVWSEKVRRK